MPIRPYLGGLVFEPELTNAMGEAFETSCRLLGLKAGLTDPATEMVSKAVVEAALAGDTDVNAMVAAVTKALSLPPGSARGPSHWARRADEARAVAKNLSSSSAREMMLRVAQNYDLLANRGSSHSDNSRRSDETSGPKSV